MMWFTGTVHLNGKAIFSYVRDVYANMLVSSGGNDHRYSLNSSAETYNDAASASRSSQQPMVPLHSDSLGAPRAHYHSGTSLRDPSPSNSSDGFGQPHGNNGSPYDESEPIVPSYTRDRHASASALPAPQHSASGYFSQPPVQPYEPSGGYMNTPASGASSSSSPAGPPPPVQGLPRPSKPVSSRRTSQQQPPPSRGFTLTDPGVVNPSPSSSNPNVRRVSRQGKRSSTTPVGGPTSPTSTSSHAGDTSHGASRRSTQAAPQLPPGAAPPQYPRYQ